MSESTLYDGRGIARAYIAGDGVTIYLWDGAAVAYLVGDKVYAWTGRHIGWFIDGIVFDESGRRCGHVRALPGHHLGGSGQERQARAPGLVGSPGRPGSAGPVDRRLSVGVARVPGPVTQDEEVGPPRRQGRQGREQNRVFPEAFVSAPGASPNTRSPATRRS